MGGGYWYLIGSKGNEVLKYSRVAESKPIGPNITLVGEDRLVEETKTNTRKDTQAKACSLYSARFGCGRAKMWAQGCLI